jgi:hypothetical protein
MLLGLVAPAVAAARRLNWRVGQRGAEPNIHGHRVPAMAESQPPTEQLLILTTGRFDLFATLLPDIFRMITSRKGSHDRP